MLSALAIRLYKGRSGWEHFTEEARDWGARGDETMPAPSRGRASGSSEGRDRVFSKSTGL